MKPANATAAASHGVSEAGEAAPSERLRCARGRHSAEHLCFSKVDITVGSVTGRIGREMPFPICPAPLLPMRLQEPLFDGVPEPPGSKRQF